MFKKELDDNIAFKDSLEDGKLADWAILNSIPPLVEFNEKYFHHIIGLSIPSVFFFINDEDFHSSDNFIIFEEAAIKLTVSINSYEINIIL
jgi:hypothetical protein